MQSYDPYSTPSPPIVPYCPLYIAGVPLWPPPLASPPRGFRYGWTQWPSTDYWPGNRHSCISDFHDLDTERRSGTTCRELQCCRRREDVSRMLRGRCWISRRGGRCHPPSASWHLQDQHQYTDTLLRRSLSVQRKTRPGKWPGARPEGCLRRTEHLVVEPKDPSI